MITEIKSKALAEHVPIIKDGGLHFILTLIKKKGYKNILELGTAVGYSSMNMALLAEDILIDTIERDPEMYHQACENVERAALKEQIKLHFMPIEDFHTSKQYDLIFVDAAKAQYGRYLEQFKDNLAPGGLFVFDNMVFHGLIYDIANIKSRNTRALVRKIVAFREAIQKDERFDIMFYDDVGDGLLVVGKRQ